MDKQISPKVTRNGEGILIDSKFLWKTWWLMSEALYFLFFLKFYCSKTKNVGNKVKF